MKIYTGKICTGCKKLKGFDLFYNNIRNIDGKSCRCKECANEKNKNEYAKKVGKDRSQIRIQNKNEFSGKIINGKKLCSSCGKWKLLINFSKGFITLCGLLSSCKICLRQYTRITNRLIKMEFLIAYGGKCVCCGETNIDLLTVEHIKNRGHKLVYTNCTSQLICRLKNSGWPKGYTVLCYNCNMSTRNGVPCAHTDEYEMYEKELESFLENDNRQEIYYELKDKLLKK